MPDTDDLDLDKIDNDDPAAIKNLRDFGKRQREAANEAAAAREKAEQELAVLRAEQRNGQVKSILSELNVPTQVADLYPADGEVSADAVKTFLKDKVGLEPTDLKDAWSRYEKIQGNTQPPVPPKDEDVEWAKKELAETARFYQRVNLPTDKETEALNDLKVKVFGKLNKWDNEVMAGQRDPMITSTGFGGLLDPPSYAVRAKHFVRTSV